jgi:hypothetical protein
MLSRLESGKRLSMPIEIVKYATLCEVVDDEQDVLVRLTGEADDYRLVPHGSRVPDEVGSVIFNESTADVIESLHLTCVPAIIQTADYAHGVFEATGEVDPARIDHWVITRMARQGILTRAEPAQCILFVHEQALRLPVGSPTVMHEQMLSLVFTNSLPHCEIRVVPAAAGVTGMARNSFNVFTYPDSESLIHIETPTTSEFIENRHDTAAYRSILDRVAKVAMTEFDSNAFFMKLAGDYEDTCRSVV